MSERRRAFINRAMTFREHFAAWVAQRGRAWSRAISAPDGHLTEQHRRTTWTALNDLAHAELSLLGNEVSADLAMAAKSYPDDQVVHGHLFRDNVGLMVFDTDHVLECGGRRVGAIGWRIFDIEDPPPGGPPAQLTVWVIVDRPGLCPYVSDMAARMFGAPLVRAPGETDHAMDPSLRFAAATLSFMRDELVVAHPQRIPAKFLKRSVAKTCPPPAGLRIIVLRQTTSKRRPDDSGRRLRFRHPRRGRWVNQPCGPRNSLRRQTWRRSTIVGDPSLPMKPGDERLFSVER